VQVTIDWVVVSRYAWAAVFGLLTPVAFWNFKEAAIDYWSNAEIKTLGPLHRTASALEHETRGSLYVQLFAFIGLLAGFVAGVFSIAMMPVIVYRPVDAATIGTSICIILMGLALGGLTIFEAARRIKVSNILKTGRSK
jgi:cytochrome c biogenesis protein CcdA